MSLPLSILFQTSCPCILRSASSHGQGLDGAVAADQHVTLRPEESPSSCARNCSALSTVWPFTSRTTSLTLQPDLPGRCVVVDERDHGAVHFLQLQRLRLFVVDVAKSDAQVALRTRVQQQRARLLNDCTDARCLRAAAAWPAPEQQRGHASSGDSNADCTASKSGSSFLLQRCFFLRLRVLF